MTSPKDFLPQSPWEGPPLPKFLTHTMYIQSLPPGRYLYHHSTYAGLKDIAMVWAIRARPDKRVVSLTTDTGRFLSPLPFLAAVTIDGIVRIPYDEEIAKVAIPCLYVSRNSALVEEVRRRGFKVYDEGSLPLEYRYILRYVTHNEMFLDENEYAVLGDYLNLSTGSEMFIDSRKIKRFMGSLGPHSMKVRPLEELLGELESEDKRKG